MRVTTVLVSVLCALVLHAHREASTAASRGFSCRLTLSPDPSFEDRWNHARDLLKDKGAERVFRKQYFVAYLFFSGYSTGKERARIRYDLRITRPDRKLYHESSDLKGWEGLVKGQESEGTLLAVDLVHSCFEPEDPSGKYEISVSAKDVATGKVAKAKSSIELADYQEGRGMEGKELEERFEEYLDSPQPERVIPALRAVVREQLWDEEKGESVTGFMREVFESNQWLFPHLLEVYPREERGVQEAALWLLAHCSFEAEAFVGGLGAEDKARWRELASGPPRDRLRAPITSPGHLDELWGMFLASGRFAPVRRLCDALAPDETGAIPEGNLRIVLRAAATWSLGSNIEQHALVRAYCESIMRSEGIGEGVRGELRKLL